MDYEKMYKEALERADSLTEKYGGREFAEYIFPELAESEDERVREWIYELVSNLGYPADEEAEKELDEMQPLALAYLEKQKENPKSADSIQSNCTSDAKCEDRWHKVSDSLPDNCRNTITTWCEIPSEKQKEQKPMYNLEIPAGDVAPAEEVGPFDEDDFLENELSAFLQNYDKEYDDDAAVSDVAKHFYEIGKKQKEQKPAEWSEEDEKNLDLVIDCVYEFYPDPVMKYKLKDWLKSLRPTWKPSEEQMARLLNIEGFLRTHQCGDKAQVITELHEQLKKLM